MTGGATNVVPGLNVTVNALVDTATGDLKGKINYDYESEGLHFIGDVTCLNVEGNDATVAAREKKNPEQYLVVRIQDNGEEGTDRLTAYTSLSESQAATHCSTTGGAGVRVTDGNFQIRPTE